MGRGRGRKSLRLVEHEGEILTLTQLAERTGLERAALQKRFSRGLRGEELVAPVKPLQARGAVRHEPAHRFGFGARHVEPDPAFELALARWHRSVFPWAFRSQQA